MRIPDDIRNISIEEGGKGEGGRQKAITDGVLLTKREIFV